MLGTTHRHTSDTQEVCSKCKAAMRRGSIWSKKMGQCCVSILWGRWEDKILHMHSLSSALSLRHLGLFMTDSSDSVASTASPPSFLCSPFSLSFHQLESFIQQSATILQTCAVCWCSLSGLSASKRQADVWESIHSSWFVALQVC